MTQKVTNNYTNQLNEMKQIIYKFQNTSEMISSIRKNLVDFISVEQEQTREIYQQLIENAGFVADQEAIFDLDAITSYFDDTESNLCASTEKILQLNQKLHRYQLKTEHFTDKLIKAIDSMEYGKNTLPQAE